MAAKVDPADVDRVWEAWRARQASPGTCKYTDDRRKLIGKRLALGYSAADLIRLFAYVWEADEPGPRWLRGENPNERRYLDLSNLLVEEKLGARVQLSTEWEASLGDQDAGPGSTPPAASSAPLPVARVGRPGGHVADGLVSVPSHARWRG